MKIVTLEEKKLKLKNKGGLELFFVGVGSAFSKKLYQTNLLIIKGNNHVLIDCGTRCTQALYELGIMATGIRNFLITHTHADHIGGLEEIALMNRYVTGKKPSMIINDAFMEILWDTSLRGGCAYNEGKGDSKLGFKDFWKIKKPKLLEDYPRETFQTNIGSINLKLVRTKHIPDSAYNWERSFWSCAVIIDNKILFTSDTRYDRDLILKYDKIFNFDIIFHDTQFFTGGVHSSIDELKQFSKKIKSKMFLTHYSDNWEDYIDKVKGYGFKGFADQHVFYCFE